MLEVSIREGSLFGVVHVYVNSVAVIATPASYIERRTSRVLEMLFRNLDYACSRVLGIPDFGHDADLRQNVVVNIINVYSEGIIS